MEEIRRLRNRGDVAAETETFELSAEEFEPDETREDEGDRAVAVVVYDGRGRVLLTRDDDWDGWVFPGGMVHHDEGLREGAIREVREETGLEPTIVDAVRVVDQRFVYPPEGEVGRLPFVLFEGRASGDPGDPADLGEPGETIHDVGWFDRVPDGCSRADTVAEFLERGPTRE